MLATTQGESVLRSLLFVFQTCTFAIISLICITAAPWSMASDNFPTHVPADLAAKCHFSEREKKLVENCLQDFAANGCDDYPSDPAVQTKLVSCNLHELNELDPAQGEKLLTECGEKISSSYKELFDVARRIPGSILGLPNWLMSPDTSDRVAREVCLTQLSKLGLKEAPPMDNSFHLAFATTTAPWYKCLANERRKFVATQNDQQKREQLQHLTEFLKNLRCFKGSYWAPMACPILSDALLFGAAGVGLKAVSRQMFISLAEDTKLTKSMVTTLHTADETLAVQRAKAGAQYEPYAGRNVDHVHDLVEFTQTPFIRRVCERLGLDCEAMVKGIIDSDIGKYASEWKARVFEDHPASNELLGVLSGRSQSPAAVEFRKMLDENGFANKTFLPSMDNEQLRKILKKYPILQTYLHEVPGMSEAITEFNHGAISKQQFRARMMANMFHNGPHAGFWRKLGEEMIPKALANADQDGKTFFHGTVFDSGETREGMISPRYPAPISAEGYVHLSGDRLSQATRGGVLKIFEYDGNSLLAANRNLPMRDFPVLGLDYVGGLMIDNPKWTVEQLAEAQAQLSRTVKFSSSERSVLNETLQHARERLEKEIDYLHDHLEKTPEGNYQFKYRDGSVEQITSATPASKVEAAIDRVLKDEEHLNGDPMKDFPYAPTRSGSFYTSAAGSAGATVLTMGICELRPGATPAEQRSAPAAR
jgi:hypothetical protein